MHTNHIRAVSSYRIDTTRPEASAGLLCVTLLSLVGISRANFRKSQTAGSGESRG